MTNKVMDVKSNKFIKVISHTKDMYVDRSHLEHASALKFTYQDLVHFFGPPIIYDGEIGRRVEWMVGEYDKNLKDNFDDYSLALDDNGNTLIATIYDSDQSIPIEENFIWYIDASVNRGFELVGEFIVSERQKGKKFISKELPEDIKRQDKDKVYKVNLTDDQKKIMEELKKINDEAKSK